MVDITLLVVARPLQRVGKTKAPKSGDIIHVEELITGRSHDPRSDFIHVTGCPEASIERYRNLLMEQIMEPDTIESDPGGDFVTPGDHLHYEWNIDESLLSSSQRNEYAREHQLTIAWPGLKNLCSSREKSRKLTDGDV